MTENITKKQFYKEHTPKDVKSKIATGAVMGYISAGLTAVMAVLMMPLMLLDAALVLGLALGVHLAKSRVCSIVLFAYFILNKVLQLFQGAMNTSSIVMAVVFASAFFYSIMGTVKFQKMWGEFKTSGQLPVTPDSLNNTAVAAQSSEEEK